ncbi:hypothetical protein H310_00104 [Aphanomyces invadans]|uniref:Uncharacterized protein n=1 Tax=Aphanomyces invadans TaxID=157072 RepID=A0A024UUF6_9STRA|nr:hypothetical protein H310_00104 [Aphanomyces invadans]ETW09552.1 hypothetical protein H310_00104 [Aphanomyces invadans]|eukprot:XP_008860963.1 hypothetical protein H310_00104 [Aphanomyces invadans]
MKLRRVAVVGVLLYACIGRPVHAQDTAAPTNATTTDAPEQRIVNATTTILPTTVPPIPTQTQGNPQPPANDKHNDDWPSNTINGTSDWSKRQGTINTCDDARGCQPWAAVYVAIVMFALLVMGMIYVAYKRRNVRRFVGSVHSPPLLEMHQGRSKQPGQEGQTTEVLTPIETSTPQHMSLSDNSRVLHR